MMQLVGILLVIMLALLSIGCIVGGLALISDQGRIGHRLRNIVPQSATAAPAASSERWSWSRVSTMTHGLTLPGQDHEEIQRGLRAAGYYAPEAVIAFGALRLTAGIVAAVAIAVLLLVTGKWAGALRWMPLAAAGMTIMLSKMALGSLAARRARIINAELPFTLDVLLMMLESGVSLDQCFRTFAQSEGRAAPMVRRTVEALVDDLQRGMSHDMALARWADRLGVTGSRELAGVFRQALAHGSEMSSTVRQFAMEFTDARISAARESIGEKTVRMTIAMMVFLMPALFIVLAGPAVATLLTTLKQFNR